MNALSYIAVNLHNAAVTVERAGRKMEQMEQMRLELAYLRELVAPRPSALAFYRDAVTSKKRHARANALHSTFGVRTVRLGPAMEPCSTEFIQQARTYRDQLGYCLDRNCDGD